MPYKSVNTVYPIALAVCVVAIVIIFYFCCFNTVTTVLLVRHAEKAETPPENPPLKSEGHSRAEELIGVADDTGVGAIYATEFCRTTQTAQPLALSLNLPVNIQRNTIPGDQLARCNPSITATLNLLDADIDTVPEIVDHLFSNHRGKVILIVGHSNTVPQIVEELGAPSLCPDYFPLSSGSCSIPDEEFDNLFVLTIPRFFGTVKIVKAKYGAANS